MTKWKLVIEQGGKGGSPPLLRDLGSKSGSGGKPHLPDLFLGRLALNYQPYFLQLVLVVLVSFSWSSISAQTLKQRINQQTDFTPQNSSPSEQLVEVARQFKLPMAIEWLEQKEDPPKPKLAFRGGTVLDLIEAIIRESPGHQLLVKDRIVYVYPLSVVSHPYNFLNLQIPNYDVKDTSLFAAQFNLRTMINIMLYPDEYKYGHNGGYGGGYPGVFWKENISFAGRDLTIRDILTGIAEKSEDALWIVRLKSDEFNGNQPKWIGVPRNKSGHSPINSRWQFLPLSE